MLNSKIDDYYLKYGELPILCNYTDKTNFQNIISTIAADQGATPNVELNANDGDEYAVIDLEKLGGITLNYGYERDGDYEKLKITRVANAGTEMQLELYVINTVSHQIYFPHGVYADKTMYYTFYSDSTDLSVNVNSINYSIRYSLLGGTNADANPTTYTGDTEITLQPPTRPRVHIYRLDWN